MPLVHGNDAFTALDFSTEANYGVYVGSPGNPHGYLRIPLLGEALFVKRDQFPKNREIGNVGALPVVDQGRAVVEGTFRVYPRYNAPWFHLLLCQAMGGSEFMGAANKMLDGVTRTDSNYGVHCYMPQSFKEILPGSASAIGCGMTIRVAKSGNTNAGSREVYTGCIIKRMTFEQPEGDRPVVTFDVLGQYNSIQGLSTVPSEPAGMVQMRARDLKGRPGLSTSNGIIQSGLKITGPPLVPARDINITSWKLVLESNAEFAPGFINSPDVLARPGHVDNWSITGEFSSLLQQAEFGTNHTLPETEQNWPAYDFIAGRSGALRLRYVSDTDIVASGVRVPYAMDFFMKNLVYTKAENGITEGGAPKTTYAFEAQRGTFTGGAAAAETESSGETSLAGNQVGNLLIQVAAQAALYADTIQGGNPIVFELPPEF